MCICWNGCFKWIVHRNDGSHQWNCRDLMSSNGWSCIFKLQTSLGSWEFSLQMSNPQSNHEFMIVKTVQSSWNFSSSPYVLLILSLTILSEKKRVKYQHVCSKIHWTTIMYGSKLCAVKCQKQWRGNKYAVLNQFVKTVLVPILQDYNKTNSNH